MLPGASRRALAMPVGRVLALAIAIALAGCESCRNPPPPRLERYQDEELAAEVLEEEAPPDPDEPAPPAISDTPVAPRPSEEREGGPAPVAPAAHGDGRYGTDEPVEAGRFVYRVRMIVPSWLGTGDDRIALPAAELYVDVSRDRLRARFAGRGWPIAAGSEVRLRRDRPGVYLFDGRGGRPLEPGELARWFEGGPVTRRGPPLRVFSHWGFPRHRRGELEGEDAPGELLCALLAEWAGEDRSGVMRRCERGAPRLWRLGFWRGEQTASVPLELPRSALRADERDPPDRRAAASSRAFLEPEALSRIRPDGPAPDPPAEGAPAEGLRVRNDSATRVIVAVQGVAIGTVDAAAEGWFVGLRPGTYDVGAIRPLGAVVQRGRPVAVPGEHRVCDGRCSRQPLAEGATDAP